MRAGVFPCPYGCPPGGHGHPYGHGHGHASWCFSTSVRMSAEHSRTSVRTCELVFSRVRTDVLYAVTDIRTDMPTDMRATCSAISVVCTERPKTKVRSLPTYGHEVVRQRRPMSVRVSVSQSRTSVRTSARRSRTSVRICPRTCELVFSTSVLMSAKH